MAEVAISAPARGWQARAIAIALLSLALSSSATAANPAWVEVRSPHFSVLTDAGEKRGRQVAERFEQMRFAFGAVFRKARVTTGVPLEIIAFRDSEDMRPYLPLFNGSPVSSAGYFLAGGESNFIAVDLSAGEGWTVVMHEYAHLLINANVVPMPAWFDEGFADYCSSLKIRSREIDLGLLPPNRNEILDRMPWMKTAELLAVTRSSSEYNEGDRRSIFYAQSWLMIHYFMSKRKMPELSRYLDETGRLHRPIRESFRDAFGMDPDQFDAVLRQYFMKEKAAYYPIPMPAGAEAITYAARPLDDLEARARLTDLHYHAKDYQQQGVREFEEIVRQQPGNAAANRGLGYAYLTANRLDEAEQCLRRALAGDANDARTHFFLAVTIARRENSGASPAAVAEITREVQAALALDSDYADAYNLLAFAQSHSGDLKGAIASERTAYDLAPRNETHAVNLAQLYLQDHDIEPARRLLQRLTASDNPSMAAMARTNLERLDQAVASGATPSAAKVEVVEGRVDTVDCTQPPSAVLAVTAGGKTLRLKIADVTRASVAGSGTFSCSWKEQRIAVRYQPTGPDTGDVVALQLLPASH